MPPMNSSDARRLWNDACLRTIGIVGSPDDGSEESYQLTPLGGAAIGRGLSTCLIPGSRRLENFESAKEAGRFLIEWGHALYRGLPYPDKKDTLKEAMKGGE